MKRRPADAGPRDDRAAAAAMVVQRRIEWSDTDASGRWHNTAAFRLVEVAETALLERLGMLNDVYGLLPRVHIEADFVKLLDFRDVVDAAIAVTDVGSTSVTYGFEIRRGDEVCMRAKVVAVLLTPEGKSRPWPAHLRTRLLSAGPQEPELLSVGYRESSS